MRFHNLSTLFQKFTYIFKCLSFLGLLNIHLTGFWRHISVLSEAEVQIVATQCFSCNYRKSLRDCNQPETCKPHPSARSAQHRSKDSRISNLWTMYISIRLLACSKHASNRWFLSNANLAIKLPHLLICGALFSADQRSTFYIHCVHTQLKGRTTNTCATKIPLASLASINLPKPLPFSRSYTSPVSCWHITQCSGDNYNMERSLHICLVNVVNAVYMVNMVFLYSTKWM